MILDNNQIKSLPKQIENLKSLKVLSIAGNRISSLPNEFSNLSGLQELNISGNEFSNFPMEILKIESLKTLYLARNKFKEFPVEKIKALQNLLRVYCYSFNIDNLASEIDSQYLMYSKLQGNLIDRMESLEVKIIMADTESESVSQSEKNKIFISYSHADKKWLEKIKRHLKVLKKEGIDFDYWDDTRIKGGSDWKEEIQIALDNAIISILLVSTDFLGSDFISENELPPLLQNAKLKGTKIIPLIVSPCRFVNNKELSTFQAINDPSKILDELSQPEQERVLIKLTDDIESYIKNNNSLPISFT